MPSTGVIYMIMNLANGMAYIGSTVHERRRLRTHMRHLRKNKHQNKALQEDFNAYGEENFTTIILARDVPEDDLHVYELSEIVVYDYDGPGTYNVGKARRITAEQRRNKVSHAFGSTFQQQKP